LTRACRGAEILSPGGAPRQPKVNGVSTIPVGIGSAKTLDCERTSTEAKAGVERQRLAESSRGLTRRSH